MATSEEEVRRLVKVFGALESQRQVIQSEWQVIERFIAPGRGKFFRTNSGEEGIEWRKRDMYDSTAMRAHQKLAASLHGSLTNPAFKWFDMLWRNLELNKNYEASIWLEAVSKRIFDELQDSNFNMVITSAYKNLTSFGTAVLTQEPKSDITEPWKGLQFTHIPLKEAYFEPDANDQCYSLYRKMEWRASKIVDKFGLDKVPDKVKAMLATGTDQTVTVLFIVWPRKDAGTARILPPDKRPYGWLYVLREGNLIMDEGGYYEMPAYTPRWEPMNESMWGFGPGRAAMGNILTLNQLVELDLTAREKVIDPALLVQERALINTLDLGPGMQNVVRDVDQIKAFESAARFDAVEATIVRLQIDIRECFFIDQLELKESPAMTATEVQVRYEMMQKMLSEILSRLKEELLDPLIQRTFNLLHRAGELPELPAGIEMEDYDIEYVGPLSRAMRFDQSASIERWVTQLQLIASLGGEAEKVLLVPDYDAIARDAARQLNLPTAYTRPVEDVEADMEKQRLQNERAASAEAAQAETEAAKNLGQAQQLAQGDPSIATGGPTLASVG